MVIIHSIADLRAYLHSKSGIAFVPTMGNLHAGHLELVRIAREHGKYVVVSIFVNPLQFGANEDFGSYPRTLQADCEQLEQLGVEVVFTPTEQELYPVPQQVTVEPPLADELCGAFRPGHFRGVATVVLKLFNIVQPQVAVFGSKDYQQLCVIRQMVAQLNLPLAIIGGETIREADGLALSSRNQYLGVAERTEAPFLYQTLDGIKQALLDGSRDFARLERNGAEALSARGWQVDYVAIRAALTLALPANVTSSLVVLAAARLGQTRLIDNTEVYVDAQALYNAHSG